MAHRGKEVLTACMDEVSRQGGRVLSTGYSGGSHQIVDTEYHGRRERFYLALSPSDGNAPKVVRQQVRRRYRAA